MTSLRHYSSLSWKPFSLHHALRLREMPPLVRDDQSSGVERAVSDQLHKRRRDNDLRRIEPFNRAQFRNGLAMIPNEPVNDLRINRARRRTGESRRLEFLMRVRRLRFDQQLSEKAGQNRHALPQRGPFFARDDPVELRME